MNGFNILDEYPALRRVLYIAQWLINGVLGIVSIVLVSLGENPQWWIITQAVFNFVWAYTGLTAQANVTPEPLWVDADPDEDYDFDTSTMHGGGGDDLIERGYTSQRYLLGLLVIVVVVLAVLAILT